MNVLLIETAAADRPGSMRRYTDLISQAFKDDADIHVNCVNLAPTAKELGGYPRRLRTLVHHATIAWRVRTITRLHPADIYHLIDGSHGYVLRWLKSERSVVTVHDIIPLLQSQRRFPVSSPSRIAQWLIGVSLRSLRRASRILAVSHCTARDVVAAQPELSSRVQVLPQPVPPAILPPPGVPLPDWETRRQRKNAYMLHLGNNGFYKNRAGVVRIFDRFRPSADCRLVLAGPPPDTALKILIQERNLEDWVDFIVDPSDEKVLSLYQNARLLLFPSYYEGFGWPPLEAMAWGCPVVCSRSGSLPEVAGDAALTAEVDDESTLAAHCLRILSDKPAADQLVALGYQQVQRFSLEKFRHDMLGVYHSLV